MTFSVYIHHDDQGRAYYQIGSSNVSESYSPAYSSQSDAQRAADYVNANGLGDVTPYYSYPLPSGYQGTVLPPFVQTDPLNQAGQRFQLESFTNALGLPQYCIVDMHTGLQVGTSSSQRDDLESALRDLEKAHDKGWKPLTPDDPNPAPPDPAPDPTPPRQPQPVSSADPAKEFDIVHMEIDNIFFGRETSANEVLGKYWDTCLPQPYPIDVWEEFEVVPQQIPSFKTITNVTEPIALKHLRFEVNTFTKLDFQALANLNNLKPHWVIAAPLGEKTLMVFKRKQRSYPKSGTPEWTLHWTIEMIEYNSNNSLIGGPIFEF